MDPIDHGPKMSEILNLGHGPKRYLEHRSRFSHFFFYGLVFVEIRQLDQCLNRWEDSEISLKPVNVFKYSNKKRSLLVAFVELASNFQNL